MKLEKNLSCKIRNANWPKKFEYVLPQCILQLYNALDRNNVWCVRNDLIMKETYDQLKREKQ